MNGFKHVKYQVLSRWNYSYLEIGSEVKVCEDYGLKIEILINSLQPIFNQTHLILVSTLVWEGEIQNINFSVFYSQFGNSKLHR